MSKRFKLQLFFGVVVTAVIVYFSVKTMQDLKLSVVFHSNIHWGIAAWSIVVYIYSNYIRALAYPLGIDPEMDRMTAFEIVGIGHALNMVLPLHAGEGLRLAFFPSEYSAMRRSKLLLLPFFADFIAIVMLSIVTVPLAHFKNPNLLKALWILVFVCIGLCVLFAVLIFLVPRLRRYVAEYLNISLVKMFVWVILSWLLLVLAFWLGLIAFGFHTMRALPLALSVFIATNIINLIPASPGSIGLFEYGTVLALTGQGVDESMALSVSLLLHMIQYAALLPLGIFLYVRAIHGKYGDTVRSMLRKQGNKEKLEGKDKDHTE